MVVRSLIIMIKLCSITIDCLVVNTLSHERVAGSWSQTCHWVGQESFIARGAR